MSFISRFLSPLSQLLSGASRPAFAPSNAAVRLLEDDAIANPGGLSERRLLQLFIDGELPLIKAEVPYPGARDLLARATPSGRCVFRLMSDQPGFYRIDVTLAGRALLLKTELHRQLALAAAWIGFDLAGACMTPELSHFMVQRKERQDRRREPAKSPDAPIRLDDRRAEAPIAAASKAELP